MIGPQNSAHQLEKISSYEDIGLNEGAELLIGAGRQEPHKGARHACAYGN
jgi:acyl-CoA reductase-like NAD-dependent aldehyde dehydrogenase